MATSYLNSESGICKELAMQYFEIWYDNYST